MPNTGAIGRTECVILQNKSGSILNYGDVVIMSGSFASAVTTTASAGYANGRVGVVLEPNGIAVDSRGLIAFSGYIPKINLTLSASLLNLVATSTTLGKGAPHAAPTATGDFAQVLETGTSPQAVLFGAPLLSTTGGGGGTGKAASKIWIKNNIR